MGRAGERARPYRDGGCTGRRNKTLPGGRVVGVWEGVALPHRKGGRARPLGAGVHDPAGRVVVWDGRWLGDMSLG